MARNGSAPHQHHRHPSDSPPPLPSFFVGAPRSPTPGVPHEHDSGSDEHAGNGFESDASVSNRSGGTAAHQRRTVAHHRSQQQQPVGGGSSSAVTGGAGSMGRLRSAGQPPSSLRPPFRRTASNRAVHGHRSPHHARRQRWWSSVKTFGTVGAFLCLLLWLRGGVKVIFLSDSSRRGDEGRGDSVAGAPRGGSSAGGGGMGRPPASGPASLPSLARMASDLYDDPSRHYRQGGASSSYSSSLGDDERRRRHAEHAATGGDGNGRAYDDHTFLPPVDEDPILDDATRWKNEAREEVREEMARRAERRRARTRPPPPPPPPRATSESVGESAGVDPRHLARYELRHLTDEAASSSSSVASDAPALSSESDESSTAEEAPLASIEQLCGFEARNASLAHPASYAERHAVGPTSRVLITGLLTPLGFHLALELHRRCGVKTIMGIDPMFPNTALHRIELQKRIAILTKTIPTLIQPVILPFVGLDPRYNPKKGKAAPAMLSSTGELDLVQNFRPTHVVHLVGAYPESHRDTTGAGWEERLNANSPYVTAANAAASSSSDGNGDDSTTAAAAARSPPMYQLRMGMVSMEHLLASIEGVARGEGHDPGGDGDGTDKKDAGAAPTRRPHFVYASHHGAPRSIYGGKGRGVGSSASGGGGAEEWGIGHAGVVGGGAESPAASSRAGGGGMGGAGRRWDDDDDGSGGMHGPARLTDEVLAATYRNLYGVESIALRFGAVYGPWGDGRDPSAADAAGPPDCRLAEAAVRRWWDTNDEDGRWADRKEENLLDASGLRMRAHEAHDFVFVDDAVDAIIAAMQYRKVGDSPDLFSIGSGELTSLSTFADVIDDYRPGAKTTAEANRGKGHSSVIDLERARVASLVGRSAKEHLHWSATTPFKEGVAKLLAWHLDASVPFGSPLPGNEPAAADSATVKSSPRPETGNEFLTRRGLPVCSSNDSRCLRGERSFPCASECTSSSAASCTPSVFDKILELTRIVTEGCDAVLYTTSLGYDVEDLVLETTYVEETKGETLVCNLAFVPSESKLVKNVIERVPASAFEKFGLSLGNVDKEETLDGLNGRLVHKGWMLIWMPDTLTPLSPDDESLMKLSPSRFFHTSVEHAMFVDENFVVPPTTEDVLFLIDEMRREPLNQRSVYRTQEDGTKKKYKLPSEPKRRAALLVAPIKKKKSDDKNDKTLSKSQKVSVYEATKFMTFEIGGDPKASEPKALKQQREFYERVTSFVNRDDVRSIYEPLYRYELKHYIRSRWVMHDTKLEESRQLRCEWYQEHTHWGNKLDQLSFAHVMARRELVRKFVRDEPDDKVKESMPNRAVLEELADVFEWHALLDEEEIDGSGVADSLLEAVASRVGEDGEEGGEPLDLIGGNEGHDLYVRIMSDKVMLLSRRAWQENKKNERKRPISSTTKGKGGVHHVVEQ